MPVRYNDRLMILRIAIRPAVLFWLAIAPFASADRTGRLSLDEYSELINHNASWLTEAEVLDAARVSGAVVWAVGVKPRLNNCWINSGRWRKRTDGQAGPFLKSITDGTGGKVSYAVTTAELQDLFLGVLTEMKTRYLLSFQVQGALERGWHSLEVKLVRSKADEVRARDGYFVGAGRDE